ncbi:MAG: hypothetical protein ABRQ27_08505 [Clostridiaceae bacterium]
MCSSCIVTSLKKRTSGNSEKLIKAMQMNLTEKGMEELNGLYAVIFQKSKPKLFMFQENINPRIKGRWNYKVLVL